MQASNSSEWITIPILPCVSIEETLHFWQALGFEITYKQTHPYQYGVVERGGHQLHFGRLKGMDAANNFYTGCLIAVPDAGDVYYEITQLLKQHIGRVPHAGIPRVSRMKPNTTRFTLTDVSGNAIIFVSRSEQDQETWEKAENKNQSKLQRAIAIAIRFRDYKNDDEAAIKTLDAALKRTNNENSIDIAEALIMRIELAESSNDPIKAAECKSRLALLAISESDLNLLREKHGTFGSPLPVTPIRRKIIKHD
jgi:hypothetical protein